MTDFVNEFKAAAERFNNEVNVNFIDNIEPTSDTQVSYIFDGKDKFFVELQSDGRVVEYHDMRSANPNSIHESVDAYIDWLIDAFV